MINMTASGNLGRDPKKKTFDSGKEVVNFSIACRTGADETTWVECAVWGTRGNTVMQYFKKGSRVTVAGSGKLVEYTTNEGKPGTKLELTVNDFTLPERQDGDSPAPQKRAAQTPTPRQGKRKAAAAPAPAPAQWNTAPLIPDTDDIPF